MGRGPPRFPSQNRRDIRRLKCDMDIGALQASHALVSTLTQSVGCPNQANGCRSQNPGKDHKPPFSREAQWPALRALYFGGLLIAAVAGFVGIKRRRAGIGLLAIGLLCMFGALGLDFMAMD